MWLRKDWETIKEKKRIGEESRKGISRDRKKGVNREKKKAIDKERRRIGTHWFQANNKCHRLKELDKLLSPERVSWKINLNKLILAFKHFKVNKDLTFNKDSIKSNLLNLKVLKENNPVEEPQMEGKSSKPSKNTNLNYTNNFSSTRFSNKSFSSKWISPWTKQRQCFWLYYSI